MALGQILIWIILRPEGGLRTQPRVEWREDKGERAAIYFALASRQNPAQFSSSLSLP
jgi:hypothetical protein